MFDESVLSRLRHREVTRLCVALSGGVDSVSLLHGLVNAGLGKEVCAMHINHGLQDAADEFTVFCENLCEEWQVKLIVRHVDVATTGSLETNARTARYAEFEKILGQGDLLLLAHHADDQVETALFRLFRGSRLPGLEGMPGERAIGAAKLFRPLLNFSRDNILAYANANNLSWIDDPTNQDSAQDRNYIRHEVLPVIEARWPNVKGVLLANISRDQVIRHKVAELDRATLRNMLHERDCIDLTKLLQREVSERISLLTTWLDDLGLPLPGGRLLTELAENETGQTLFAFQGIELRHFRDRLYVLRALTELRPLNEALTNSDLDLDSGSITNSCVKGQGLVSGCDYRLTYRSGGEKLKIRHNRSLKNLFQETGTPEWLRDRIPLIYQGDQLVAVSAVPSWGIPMLIADSWSTSADGDGWLVELQLSDRVY